MDVSDLNIYNPYGAFRPGQAEAISQMLDAFDDGQKVVELDAPTASGKSLDLYVLGRILSEEFDQDKTIYSTPLVALANQLGREEKFSKMPVLKGKRNYHCAMLPGINADDCPFKTYGHALAHCKFELQHPDEMPCAACEYQRDRKIFMDSNFGATTFARYIVDPACHSSCRSLLIDESAGLEKALVDFSTLSLPENIDKRNLRSEIVAYNQEIMEDILNLEAFIKRQDDLRTISYAVKRINKLGREAKKCIKVIGHIDSNHKYIIDKDMRFRLLEGKSEFDRMIENLDFVVLASGTPTTEIYAEKYTSVKIQHPIPLEKRLIYFWPVGSMNYADRIESMPKIAKAIKDLHAKYHKKTIVHCYAYTIARDVYETMDRETRSITILQNGKDRESQKDEFLSSDDECIFLSVAYTEGLDLKGPDYPMNVIIRIPFEPTKDEFVAARNESDNKKRYNLFTAVEVMQAAGRCTRSPDDYSETYIIDQAWERFYNARRKLFKPWFSAALRRYNGE